jgi:hypothetical protein
VLYRFATDIWFGYMWRQQGYAYSVLAHYSNQLDWNSLHHFIDSLVSLGSEWHGTTSQGRSVSVYLAGGCVDWSVGYVAMCGDGSRVSPTFAEDLVRLQRDGTFSDTYACNFRADDGTGAHSAVAMSGLIPRQRSATGSFADRLSDIDDRADRAWACRANVSWQAHPI